MKKRIVDPTGEPSLGTGRAKRLKMARSAHAYVRGEHAAFL
jgi:hypothetical protein